FGTLTGYPLIAAASAAIFLGTLGSRQPILGSKALVYLGKISYGLYVYHILGLRISYWIFRGHTSRLPGFAVFFLVGLGLTVVLSAISYEWLEKPFLRLKERYTHIPSRPD